MVEYNYIEREDNIGKIISEDAMLDAVDIEETLKSKYIYIYNSIKETNYKLKVNHCTFFKEIIFKKKVVGFFAYTIINSISNLSLVASYIIPEYRGKGLFFDEINKTFEEGKEISIYQPSRFVIELLIKYGFAKELSENLVVTSIKIDIPSNMISNIYGSDKLIYKDYMYTSNIYVMDLCGFVIIPTEDEKILYLTSSYSEDEKKYDSKTKRENLTNEYFKNLFDILDNEEKNIQDFIKNIRKNYSLLIEEDFDKNQEIDFEQLKKIKKDDESEENIVKIFEKIDKNKHTLLEDKKEINIEKYIAEFKNVIIYDFIRIFNENKNLELTNSIIKIDYDFNSEYIMNLVVKEGYIEDTVDVKKEEKYLKSLKVNELKDILKNNNLTLTGNKSELIKRIIEYVPAKTIMKTDYQITQKGYAFINEHSKIGFYNLFLKNYYYYEFNDFLKNHEGTSAEISKSFLEEHLKVSVAKKDNNAYIDSLNALASINEIDNNIDKSLYFELKKFIVGLNPIFFDESSYNYYQPINERNIENLKTLLSEKEFNLEDEFKNAWENMEVKEFLIPFDKSLSILKQMISGEDRDYMNDKVREEYLTKENTIHDKLDKSLQSTLDKYLNII